MKRNGNHFGVDLGIILGSGIISGLYRVQVYERMRISTVEVCERVGKSFI